MTNFGGGSTAGASLRPADTDRIAMMPFGERRQGQIREYGAQD
jgi:hypothetical protein